MRRLLPALICVFLACPVGSLAGEAKQIPPAQAAEIVGQLPLRYQYESVHFTLYMDFADEAYAARLQGDLEQYFSQFQKEYWDFIRPQYREAHIELAVLGTRDAYDAIATRDLGQPRKELGYSNNAANRVAFLRQDEYSRDVMIVVHELTHVFNRFSLDFTPIWLDEGMAQYYAYIAAEKAGNTKLIDGVHPDALALVVKASEDASLVHLPALLQMADAEFSSQDSTLHYAESWALVYYLRRGIRGGDDILTIYYSALAANTDPLAAFGKTYTNNYKGFEAEWLSYVKSVNEQLKAPGTREENNVRDDKRK